MLLEFVRASTVSEKFVSIRGWIAPYAILACLVYVLHRIHGLLFSGRSRSCPYAYMLCPASLCTLYDEQEHLVRDVRDMAITL